MEQFFIASGPAGLLAWILWRVFNRLVDTHASHNERIAAEMAATRTAFGDEMKADREASRADAVAMRAEHREELAGIRVEIGGLRDEIRGAVAPREKTP